MHGSLASAEQTLHTLLPLVYRAPGDEHGWRELATELSRQLSLQRVVITHTSLDHPVVTTSAGETTSPALCREIGAAGELRLYASEGVLERLERSDLLTPLCRHLDHALQSHAELMRYRLLESLSLDTLPERFNLALMVLDGNARLLHASPLATRTLGTPELPLRVRAGHLQPGQRYPLRETLRESLLHGERRYIHLRRNGQREGLNLVCTPLDTRQLRPSQQRILLAFSLPPSQHQRTFGLGAYRFTARERELVQALLRGDDLPSHAEARSVSLNTVKSQLRSVLGKTATHRQSQLIRRLLLAPSPVPKPIRL